MTDTEYILGTQDDELIRLENQHQVWKKETESLYQAAQFNTGQTILDLGCGLGLTTIDLHNIVGHTGTVKAIDASEKFMHILQAKCKQDHIHNIEIQHTDVQNLALPATSIDGAFARWRFCFLDQPDALIQQISKALKPGGTFAILDYINYQALALQPPSTQFKRIFGAVYESFQNSGGGLDIGGYLPDLLNRHDLNVIHLNPICHLSPPGSPIWNWVQTFQDVYVTTLIDKYFTQKEYDAFRSEWKKYSQTPGTFLFGPPMVSIVAQKG